VEEGDSASVRRLLDVLDALAEPTVIDSRGVPAAELGERVRRERTALAPTVEALAAAGLVDRDADGDRVRAGWGLYLLAARVVAVRARAVASRYVDELVERTGESAYALRLHGLHSVTEAERSGPRDLHVSSWLGRPFPVYGSDAGPALLLDLEREELEARFRDVHFEAFGPNTPRTPAELYERVERARRRGWALLDEEGEPGIASAAAPVRTFTGEIALALAVVGPRFRLLDRIEEAGRVVADAAGRMSAELGYRAPYAAASASAASRSNAAASSTDGASRLVGAESSSAATIAPPSSRTGTARPVSPASGSSSTRT
jgi:DNA-binding IclR family transcriptional regulator